MTASYSIPVADELEQLFAQTFFSEYQTLLQGGADEPEYCPGTDHAPSYIVYTQDYVRSALHEIAHWCVAGPERRRQPDYGYWYAPDGRDGQQQALFERVEVHPQALELIFCAACNLPFRVSLDNLDGPSSPAQGFEQAVRAKAEQLLVQGLAPRAARWTEVLCQRYRDHDHFLPDWLDQAFLPWLHHPA